MNMKTTSCILKNVHFPKSSNERTVIRKPLKASLGGEEASTGKNTLPSLNHFRKLTHNKS